MLLQGDKMAVRKKPSSGTASSVTPTLRSEVTTDFPNMLATALRPLLDQVTNLNSNFDALQKQLKETTTKTEETVKALKKVDAKANLINQRLEAVEKERISDKEQLLQLQMEKSLYVLRFQGIPEQKGENLKEILSEALAPVADHKAESLQSDIDMVYRTYPDFIKKNKLSSEVFVKFSKRSTRDTILKATNGITLKIKDEETRVLTDIPFEIRKLRKQYKNLTTFLQQNSIPFRWIFPEGLLFNYKEIKEKIDSVSKAKVFLEQHQTTVKEKGKAEDNNKIEEISEHGSGNRGSTSDSPSEDSESEKGATIPKLLKVKLNYDKNKHRR